MTMLDAVTRSHQREVRVYLFTDLVMVAKYVYDGPPAGDVTQCMLRKCERFGRLNVVAYRHTGKGLATSIRNSVTQTYKARFKMKKVMQLRDLSYDPLSDDDGMPGSQSTRHWGATVTHADISFSLRCGRARRRQGLVRPHGKNGNRHAACRTSAGQACFRDLASAAVAETTNASIGTRVVMNRKGQTAG